MSVNQSPHTSVLIGNHVDVRGVGDQLLLTGVIREVAEKWPGIDITVKSNGDHTIFKNNPYIMKLEEGLIPNSIDVGTGHYIQQKCRHFGIENPKIKGDIHFDEFELEAGRRTLEQLSGNRPTIILCANSTDPRKDWTTENWERVVSILNSKYDVYQIEERVLYCWQGPDIRVLPTIRGAKQDLRTLSLRRAMAVMANSKKHLGIDTAFMHIAAALDNDCFIYWCTRLKDRIPYWGYPQHKIFLEEDKIEDIITRIEKDWL